jgi:hypothetical protein
LSGKQKEQNAEQSNLPEHGGQMVNGEFVKSHGINWFVASLFLVGEVGGGKF